MSDYEIITEPESGLAPVQTGGAPAMSGMLPAAAAARMAEVQVSANFARQCPRSVMRAREGIAEACKSGRFAENAEYSYSKGGTDITGASIDLLKAIAIEWRNIQYGWEIVTTEGMFSTVRAFAWDVERNVPSSITFRVRHWIDTRGGGRACRDERETYELIANQASRRVRACLENVVPSYIVDEALDACRLTLSKQGGEKPLRDQVKAAVDYAAGLGVTKEMLEEKFQRSVDALEHLHLARLRRMFKAIVDKVATVEEHFPAKDAKPAAASGAPATDLAGVAAKLKEKSKGSSDPLHDPNSPEGKALAAKLDAQAK